jgi:hypothetical protein
VIERFLTYLNTLAYGRMLLVENQTAAQTVRSVGLLVNGRTQTTAETAKLECGNAINQNGFARILSYKLISQVVLRGIK